MKRYRKKVESSSLELLLDTMCNTFGGVMFIAISLVVIISLMTRDIPEKSEETTDIKTLQKEIVSLQKIYAGLLSELQSKSEHIKLLQSDLSRKIHQELLMLMQLQKTLQVKINTVKLTNKTLSVLLEKNQKSAELLQKQTMTQAETINMLQQQILADQQKLAKLITEEQHAPTLSFKIMERSNQPPFFLMLYKNMVYPVGPWQVTGKPEHIDKAVKVTSYQHENTHVISCVCDLPAGTLILKNNDFTQEFQELLNKIPVGRIPKFFITPGSAPTAYKMREIMKKRNISHGTILAPSDDSPFLFKFTREAEYEY